MMDGAGFMIKGAGSSDRVDLSDGSAAGKTASTVCGELNRHRLSPLEIAWWIPWFAAVLVALVVAGAATSFAKRPAPPMVRSLRPAVEQAGLSLSSQETEALAALETIYDKRPELRDVFGEPNSVNLPALVLWAASDADGSTFKMIPYRSGFRSLLWQIEERARKGTASQ